MCASELIGIVDWGRSLGPFAKRVDDMPGGPGQHDADGLPLADLGPDVVGISGAGEPGDFHLFGLAERSPFRNNTSPAAIRVLLIKGSSERRSLSPSADSRISLIRRNICHVLNRFSGNSKACSTSVG